MIDLFSTMQVVLEESGFAVRAVSVGRLAILCFEDEASIGFGYVFPDPSTLIANWQATETSVLARYAPSLRKAADKAWNVYSVFLSSTLGGDVEARQIRWIEENLERTRKIASCEIAIREDLLKVLLPLLPLQYDPILQDEDITERLNRRIRTIAPQAADVVLDESVQPAEVIALLGAPQ